MDRVLCESSKWTVRAISRIARVVRKYSVCIRKCVCVCARACEWICFGNEMRLESDLVRFAAELEVQFRRSVMILETAHGRNPKRYKRRSVYNSVRNTCSKIVFNIFFSSQTDRFDALFVREKPKNMNSILSLFTNCSCDTIPNVYF